MIQKIRIASLIGVNLLILAHIYIFGDEIIGSLDFQEFFHAFIKLGVINSGVILVLAAFIVTLIFGRFFCGWACHFGAIQELGWYMMRKLEIAPKTLNSSLVTILPLFMLLNFYIAPNLIYSINIPWEGIRVKLSVPEIWAFLPGFVIGTLTFIVDGFLIVYFLGRKGFCRYLCPWGSFLKLPNLLAMFKVRNTGGCIQSGKCSSNCPVGIDVSYEINNYGKVTNTNCTSCLICTGGCPSSTLSYKWENPLHEDFQLKHYIRNQDSFGLEKIKDNFQNLQSRDYFLLPLTLLFGFAIDGLYGMGHFLSFGISIIASVQVLTLKDKIQHPKLKNLIIGIIFIIIIWHGFIKFSIWQGINYYKNNQYESAIPHLERVVKIYPKSIGRFHVILGRIYLDKGDKKKALVHALQAIKINPTHNSSLDLLNDINIID